MTRTIEKLLVRLAAAQSAHPWRFVLASYVVIALSLPFLARLRLDSDFRALLPTDKPSVVDYERIRGRVGGLQTLVVVLESADTAAMIRLADDAVPRLVGVGAPYVRAVDYRTTVAEDFVETHRELYADLASLEELRDALADRISFERGKANPFFVQLDDEAPPDPRAVLDAMRARARERATATGRHESGYYVHANGRALALFIRSDVRSSRSADVARLLREVGDVFRSLEPARYAGDLRVGYAGAIIDDRQEHDAIEHELTLATTLSVVFVMALLWVYFRRARCLPVIGFALLVPVLATFAFAQVAVGFLNTSTAFLGSIVVGNGVNPNIVWLARYFEERRRGADLAEAVRATHGAVWQATLAASLAASVAYGSLVVTDFRGFRDFGVIGLVGMVLCWLGAMLLLPACTVIIDRHRPLVRPEDAASPPWIGPLVARLVFASPRTVVAATAALSLVAAAVSVQWIRSGEAVEYDFRNLRSSTAMATESQRLGGIVRELRGGQAQADSSIYVVLDRREDVSALRTTLENRAAAGAPWGAVRTLDDALPADQEAKLPVLAEIRELLLQMRRYADPELQRTLDENLPPATLAPLTLADLPEELARTFSERDGTRGRLLVVARRPGESIWDGRYLVRWATELREVRLPNGERPPLAGRAPVFADMLESVFVDGPKAVVASLGLTLLLILLTFRAARDRLLTATALLLGVLWMIGLMAVLGLRLNFLNFVAFPITCGNGVDYGVNVMKRFALERGRGRAEAVRAAISESGGAVVLCSLTTVVGYATILVSSNAALRSFGLAMTVSELTCLATAVVAMPAMLLVCPPSTTSRSRSVATTSNP